METLQTAHGRLANEPHVVVRHSLVGSVQPDFQPENRGQRAIEEGKFYGLTPDRIVYCAANSPPAQISNT